jgi:hypothetical protein
MAINSFSRELPTTVGNPPVGDTINYLHFLARYRSGKAFSSLRVALALLGHTPRRADLADGLVTYWAESWGLSAACPPCTMWRCSWRKLWSGGDV